MRREEFKDWLLARGVGQKSAAFRASAVRQVERAMAVLGDPSTDIDEAFAADGFQRLRAGLDALIEDRKRSGEKFRVLFPQAEKPDNMLRNRRAFLGQYGAFLRSLSQPERRSAWSALEEMRAEFLRRAPDFVDFTQREGTYYEGERAYKDAIRERVMQITASDADDAEAGKRIVNALIPANAPRTGTAAGHIAGRCLPVTDLSAGMERGRGIPDLSRSGRGMRGRSSSYPWCRAATPRRRCSDAKASPRCHCNCRHASATARGTYRR